MALNIFLVGLDTEDGVLAIRQKAIENLTAGVITTSWTSENTSETIQQTLPTKVILEECNLFLQKVNPTLYGKRVTRTRAGFNTWF